MKKGKTAPSDQGSLFDSLANNKSPVGQVSADDPPEPVAKPEPVTQPPPEGTSGGPVIEHDTCSANMGNAVEATSENPDQLDEDENIEDTSESESESETSEQLETHPAINAEVDINRLFSQTEIHIGLTLMPDDGDQDGRQVVGSISAENFDPLLFSVRGRGEATTKLGEMLRQFKRELLQRQEPPESEITVSSTRQTVKPSVRATSRRRRRMRR